MSAATGAAHHKLKNALSERPSSRIAERYIQNSDYFASACMAAMPRARPTFRFAFDRSVITTNEAHAKMIPAELCSGARLVKRSMADSNAT